MGNKKPTYEELERRLTDAEAVMATLRKGEVDAIIGERNVALLRAKEAEQALRQSEQKLRLIFEAASDGLAVTDLDGNLLLVNEAVARMHGYDTKEELIGRSVFELFAVEDRASAAENVKRTLELGHLGEVGYTLLKKDGSEFNAEIGAAVLTNASGNPIGLVVSVRDITKRKELDHLKDEFIGMVSHELSNPLTVITGCLNTVLDEATKLSEQERNHLLRNAAKEADTLSHLLGNLLELSRAQAERLFLHVEPIETNIVARNVIERITEQYPTYELLLDFPEGFPPVDADPLRVERILYNLLDNACKYSPKGSKVRVFAKPDKDNVIIGVSDQGVGIATTDREKIFQAFERLELTTPGRAKGTGIGLLVCKRLVEAHGGRIWVESAPGKGSTFFLALPYNRKA